ncbi:MAG: substrate-binding domain-containing protein [Verrucomicrobia bacterium]|nr:substrate-binding domain-containing protein [Verrucomicrobiota bacterium]
MNAILGATKSKEFQHFLREQIQQGVYKPSDKIPSIRAFAQKYALNKTTVNLAIANLAAEGLLVSQVGKGTLVVKPNKPNVPNIIGYIFDSGISPEYPSIALHIKHLTKTFAENHCSLVANEYPAAGGMCENPDFQEKIRNHFFSGLIAYTSVSLEDIVFLKKYHVPLVIVGEESNDEQTASVCADMFEAGMSLTNHLVKLGHTQIALLTGPAGNKTGELMELGYRAVMAKHDLTYPSEYVMASPWGEDGGGILAGQILGLKERPTAIITAEEIMALGVMKKLLASGHRIPEDFAVAGVADRLPVSAYPVPLTVSDTDERSQIIKAADLLFDLIRKNKPDIKIRLRPQLIIRQSCGATQLPRQTPTPLASEANVCRTPAAFTLVELLVVIAIISVLAALLSPALKGARDSAHAAKCASNFHQIGVAMTMYLDDNSGRFFAANAGGYAWYQREEPGVSDFTSYLKMPPWNFGNGWKPGSVLDCPTRKDSAIIPIENNLVEYAYNNQYVRDGKNSGDLRNPEGKIIFAEASFYKISVDYLWFNYILNPHRNGENVLFLDGHVESLYLPTEAAQSWPYDHYFDSN